MPDADMESPVQPTEGGRLYVLMNRIILHPILFALYPVISLTAVNRETFELSIAITPSLCILGCTVAFWGLMRARCHDWTRAGIAATVLLAFTFSYGPVYQQLTGTAGALTLSIAGRNVDWHSVLLPIWCSLFALAAWGLYRKRTGLRYVNYVMNIVSIALLVMPTSMIVVHQLRNPAPRVKPAGAGLEGLATPPQRPNIFYILLDGYGRNDVLHDLYGYDNRPFLAELEKRGFYVAEKSHANYCQTILSLSSTLHLNYHSVAKDEVVGSVSRRRLHKQLRNNRLFSFLRSHGYVIAATASGYALTTLDNVDIFMSPRFSLNEFHHGLLNQTVLSAWQALFAQHEAGRQYELHADLIESGFQHLEDIRHHPKPFIMLAHLILPHPPFVFRENGERAYPDSPFSYNDGSHFMHHVGSVDQYREGYIHQLTYCNQKLLALVDKLQSTDGQQPVIILQSDHGPGSRLDWSSAEGTDHRERMGILNACYLPGGRAAEIPNDISSVNTFRMVINKYWQADLPILENRAYYSTYAKPTDFVEVTGFVRP